METLLSRGTHPTLNSGSSAGLVLLFGTEAAMGLFASQKTPKYSLNLETLCGPSTILGQAVKQLLRGVWMDASRAVRLLWCPYEHADTFPEWGMWRVSPTTGWACSVSSAAAIKGEVHEQLVWILVWWYGTVLVTQCVPPGDNARACSPASGCCACSCGDIIPTFASARSLSCSPPAVISPKAISQ